MFDLFRRRDKAVRYLLTAILAMVALSMITYLIPSAGSTARNNDDTSVVAEIGDIKISTTDVMHQLEAIVREGKIQPDMVGTFLPRAIDTMVEERAAVYEFQRLGLTATDEEVLGALTFKWPQYFENGKFAKEQFEVMLAQQEPGLTLDKLLVQLRQAVIMTKVQNMIFTTAVVTPKEADEQLFRRHEKAKITYIAFPAAKFRSEINPTQVDLKGYFDGHRGQYQMPEKRSFQALVVDQEKVEASMVVTDDQVRAAYNASLDNFRMPERVRVRHILIKTAGKSDPEKKQALQKAQDLLKQLKAGADFGETAKKNSEDTESAQKGGEMDWLMRGQMASPEFEKAVFTMKPKERSEVITTSYGYDIAEVIEKEPARVKPFNEVKADLATQIKKDGLGEKVQITADQAHAALQKSPGSAAEIAKQLNLELVNVPNAMPGQAIPTLGIVPQIESALGALKKNEVTQVMVLPNNRLAVLVLNDRTPGRAAEFNEVDSQVREAFIVEKSQMMANERAKEAAGKLNAGGDMQQVAKSMKLDLIQPDAFTRNDSVEGLGPAAQFEDAYHKPAGTVIGPIEDQGRKVVYKVLEKTSEDPAILAAERDSIISALKQRRAELVYRLFMESVVAKLEADGTVKLHQDVIKRMSATYLR